MRLIKKFNRLLFMSIALFFVAIFTNFCSNINIINSLDKQDNIVSNENSSTSKLTRLANEQTDSEYDIVYAGVQHGVNVESTNLGLEPAYPVVNLADAYSKVKNGGTIYIVDKIDIAEWPAINKNVTIEGWQGTINGKTYNTPTINVPQSITNWILYGDTIIQKLTIKQNVSGAVLAIYPNSNRLQIGSGEADPNFVDDSKGYEAEGTVLTPRVKDVILRGSGSKWFTVITGPSNQTSGDYGYDEAIEKIDIHLYGLDYVEVMCRARYNANSQNISDTSKNDITTPNLKTVEVEIIGTFAEYNGETASYKSKLTTGGYDNSIVPAFDALVLETVNFSLGYIKMDNQFYFMRCTSESSSDYSPSPRYAVRRDPDCDYDVYYNIDNLYYKSNISVSLGQIYTNGDLYVNAREIFIEHSGNTSGGILSLGMFKDGTFNLYESHMYTANFSNYNGYQSLNISVYDSVIEKLNVNDNAVLNAYDNTVIESLSVSSNYYNHDSNSVFQINAKGTITLPPSSYVYNLNVNPDVTVYTGAGCATVNNINNNGTIIVEDMLSVINNYVGGTGSLISLDTDSLVLIQGNATGSLELGLYKNFDIIDAFKSTFTYNNGDISISMLSYDEYGITNEIKGKYASFIKGIDDYQQPNTVYLKADGDDSLDGSSYNNAVQSIQRAYELAVAGNKQIVLASKYSYELVSNIWQFGLNKQTVVLPSSPIVFTSNDGVNDFRELTSAGIVTPGADKKIYINGSFHFKDINFIASVANNHKIEVYCNGYPTIIGKGTTMSDSLGIKIYGGAYNKNVDTTNLRIEDGQFYAIYGGCGGYSYSVKEKITLNVVNCQMITNDSGGDARSIFGGNYYKTSDCKLIEVNVTPGEGQSVSNLLKIVGGNYNYYSSGTINLTVSGNVIFKDTVTSYTYQYNMASIYGGDFNYYNVINKEYSNNINLIVRDLTPSTVKLYIYGGGGYLSGKYTGNIDMTVDGVSNCNIIGGFMSAYKSSASSTSLLAFTGTITMNIGLSSSVEADDIYGIIGTQNYSYEQTKNYQITEYPTSVIMNIGNLSLDNIDGGQAYYTCNDSQVLEKIVINVYDNKQLNVGKIKQIGDFNNLGKVIISSTEFNALYFINSGNLEFTASNINFDSGYIGNDGSSLILIPNAYLTITGNVQGTTDVSCTVEKKNFTIIANSENVGTNPENIFVGDGVAYEDDSVNSKWFFDPYYISNMEYVYVDGINGNDEWNGQSDTKVEETLEEGQLTTGPVKTLARAYAIIKNGGVIIVSGQTELDIWPGAKKDAIITSNSIVAGLDEVDYRDVAYLKYTGNTNILLNGDLTLRYVNFRYTYSTDYIGIDADGNKLVIGDASDTYEGCSTPANDVVFNLEKTDGTLDAPKKFMIIGGGFYKSTLSGINLELYNVNVGVIIVMYGTLAEIYPTVVNGNVNVILQDAYTYNGMYYSAMTTAIVEQGSANSTEAAFTVVNGDVYIEYIMYIQCKDSVNGSKLFHSIGNCENMQDFTISYINKSGTIHSIVCREHQFTSRGITTITYETNSYSYIELDEFSYFSAHNFTDFEEYNLVYNFIGNVKFSNAQFCYEHIGSNNDKLIESINMTINIGDKILGSSGFVCGDGSGQLFEGSLGDRNVFNSFVINYYPGTKVNIDMAYGQNNPIETKDAYSNYKPIVNAYSLRDDLEDGSQSIINLDNSKKFNNVYLVVDNVHVKSSLEDAGSFDITLKNGGKYSSTIDKTIINGNFVIDGSEAKIISKNSLIVNGNMTLNNANITLPKAVNINGSYSGINSQLFVNKGSIMLVESSSGQTIVNYNGGAVDLSETIFVIISEDNGSNGASVFAAGTNNLNQNINLTHTGSVTETWTFGNELVSKDHIIYLSDSGDDSNSGRTILEAVKTLKRALEIVEATPEMKQYIVICGNYTFNNDEANNFIGDIANKEVIITQEIPNCQIVFGNSIIFKDKYEIPCDLAFENIYVSFENTVNSFELYAGGHKLTIGQGFEAYVSSSFKPTIYGGSENNDVENTYLNIYTGTWFRIYGGGKNGNVSGDTIINLGNKILGIAPTIMYDVEMDYAETSTSAIFGGGHYGNVDGSTNVNIYYGNNYGFIFGGGHTGYVNNNTSIIMHEGFAYRLYGASYIGNVNGCANIELLGGTVNRIYGAGFSLNARTNNTNVIIGDGIGAKDAIINNYVRGSGDQGGVIGVAKLTIKEGAIIPATCNIVAGGYTGSVGQSYLVIEGGEIYSNIYAGGAGEFIIENGVVKDEIDETKGYVSQSKFEIIGGIIYGNVFGGGNLGNVGEKNSPITLVTEGSITGGTVINNVYGGGNLASTYGNIEMIINMATGSVENKVFGGGRGDTTKNIAADVVGTITLTIIDGNVLNGIYGACDSLGDVNETYVVINGYANSNVYAGGYGNETYVETTRLVLNILNEQLDASSLSVYGGGEQGLINTSYVTVLNYGGTVFAGGKGYLDGLTLIDANSLSTNVSIEGNFIGNLYGGGELATVGDSSNIDTNVTNIIINDGIIYGNIYGGGKGILNESYAEVYGNTLIEVLGGTIYNSIDYPEYGNIFGGAQMSPISGTTNVNIFAGNILNVFGGNDISGIIKKDTNVIVCGNSAKVENLYGGGRLADYNTGITNVIIERGSVTNAYGGGLNADTRASNLIITGGYTTNAYGGGDAATITEIATVTIEAEYNNEKIVGTLYGGNNKADMDIHPTINFIKGYLDTFVLGGNKGNMNYSTGLTYTFDAENIRIDTIYGGCNQADVTSSNGVNLVFIAGNYGTIYGGNNISGSVMESNILINKGEASTLTIGTVYGGGNKAELPKTTINLVNGTVDTLYGGGNEATITSSTTINIGSISRASSNVNVTTLYGGNNKADMDIHPTINLYSGYIDNFHGGGNAGNMNISELSYTFDNSNVSINNLFGGCKEANVLGDVRLTFSGTKVNKVYGGCDLKGHVNNVYITVLGNGLNTIYGGGYGELTTVDNTYINVKKGTINSSIYGGSGYGFVDKSNIVVAEDNDSDIIVVKGSIFGAGYGVSSVTNDTYIVIDLNLDISENGDVTVIEGKISTVGDNVPSGETQTSLKWNNVNVSMIQGSVYGGGDMGKVGNGIIDKQTNTAEITTEGSTFVHIQSGYIQGSVFGGGSGIPAIGIIYTIEMGTVFGKCNVLINGGLISSSIYGCGFQSRVFSSDDREAAIVNIIETDPNNEIIIGISVFGGGNKGEGTSQNASVYTVIGNTTVNIIGINDEYQTPIYFISSDKGGVYGDGNLCLVQGKRVVNITDFNIANNNESLKTFYSLQRADEVNLTRTRIVLEGAQDLVDENADNTLYSINRVKQLNMYDNSTIKLTTIVNLLGDITSDQNTDTIYVDKGNNGINSYTDKGGSADNISRLTESEMAEYRAAYQYFITNGASGTYSSTYKSFNYICIANGRYLELKKSDSEYASITGLFCLGLLYPNVGEGGGYVYADIYNSTGDFICMTLVEENSGVYMDILDNVGGLKDGNYRWYFWYIKGSTYKHNTFIYGYIGTTQKSFEESVHFPEILPGFKYVLYGINGNKPTSALNSSNSFNSTRFLDYWNNSCDDLDAYAIELVFVTDNAGVLSEVSYGYLTYNYSTDKWGIKRNGNSTIYGTGEDKNIDVVNENSIYDVLTGTNAVDLKLVLHKGQGVNVELRNVGIQLNINILLDGSDESQQGFIINTYTSIIRVVPTQASYINTGHLYAGVNSNSEVMITSKSAFTAQFITRYVPSAFNSNGQLIKEVLSFNFNEKYLLDEVNGIGFTIKESNNTIEIIYMTGGEEGLYEIIKVGNDYYYSKDGGSNILLTVVSSTSSNLVFPKGTVITLIAKMDDYESTYWYYYCTGDEKEISLSSFVRMNNSQSSNNTYSFEAASNYQLSSQTSNRITENLIFIVDFGNVDENASWWSSGDIVNGIIKLRHQISIGGYTNVDIMDYVVQKSVDNGNGSFTTTYTHAFPVPTSNIEISEYSTGIQSVVIAPVDENKDYYYHDTFDLMINIKEDEVYENTNYDEREYAIKLELLDESNNVIEFPTGTQFIYEGNLLQTGKNNSFVIIPVRNEGIHYIQMVTGLEGFSGNSIKIKYTLYSSSVSSYYNEFETPVEDDFSINISQNPETYLSVSNNEHLYEMNSEIEFNVKSDNNENVEVFIYMYDQENDYYNKIIDYSIFNMPFEKNGNAWSTTIANEIPIGAYRLEFVNGDKVCYYDIIIN